MFSIDSYLLMNLNCVQNNSVYQSKLCCTFAFALKISCAFQFLASAILTDRVHISKAAGTPYPTYSSPLIPTYHRNTLIDDFPRVVGRMKTRQISKQTAETTYSHVHFTRDKNIYCLCA